jgi:transcriptional regulator with XRE-family HTH domain
MASEAAQNLMKRLREVVGKERGSQSELARKLGVPRQRLNDWLNLKSTPRLDDGLKIQAFLQKQHRQKAK